MLIRVFALFSCLCLSTWSLADSIDAVDNLAPGTTVEGMVSGHSDESVPEQIFWDFITCVHDDHECIDEAGHHHFPHWKTVHDHGTCHGHAHLACYGGHH